MSAGEEPTSAGEEPMEAGIAPELAEQYAGFRVPQRGWCVPRVDPSEVDAATFFSEYVAARKPCVLTTGLLPTSNWGDLQGIAELAGDAEVQVELRDATHTTGHTFGRGKRVTMPFCEFVERIAGGDDSMYFSTQELEDPETGAPLTFAPPITQMVYGPAGLPVRPSLLATLVPRQINAWIGRCTEGTSSGLHHDYEDNLYAVVAGRKRFHLFSPDQAACMYTEGLATDVFPNGRINYLGSERIRGDGAPTHPDNAPVSMQAAEAALAAAEEALEALQTAGRPEDDPELVQAQAQLEEAEAAMADAMFAAADDCDDMGVFEGDSDVDWGSMDADDDAQSLGGDPEPEPEPDHFSRVPVSRVWAHVAGEAIPDPEPDPFPRFADAVPAVAHVGPGECLFLPAGWFHEVTSFSEQAAQPGDTSPFHMAINWWFYPPTENNPDAPYPDGHWEADFAARHASGPNPAHPATATKHPRDEDAVGVVTEAKRQRCL